MFSPESFATLVDKSLTRQAERQAKKEAGKARGKGGDVNNIRDYSRLMDSPKQAIRKEGKKYVVEIPSAAQKSFDKQRDAIDHVRKESKNLGIQAEKAYLASAYKAIENPSSVFKDNGVTRYKYSPNGSGTRNTAEYRTGTLTAPDGQTYSMRGVIAPSDAPKLREKNLRINSAFENTFYVLPVLEGSSFAGQFKLDYNLD